MILKINKLTLVGFRGATKPFEVEFDTSKPVALVFGENGTGKSTIADAFDFTCNRRFGSLEDRSMADLPKSHVASLGQDPKKLEVILSTTIGDFSAILSKDGPIVTPSTDCPDAKILRRSKILQLIDEQPKQRFEALKAFIAVPLVEKAENALRQACRNASDNYSNATRAYEQANAALKELWVAEGTQGKNAIQWAEAEAKRDITTLQSVVKEVETITLAFRSSELSLESLDRAKDEFSGALENITKTEEEQQKVESRKAGPKSELLTLLKDAKTYLETQKTSVECPVCEKGIKATELIARITVRISEMQELASVMKAVFNAQQTVQNKKSIFTRDQKEFLIRMKTLGNLLKASSLQEVANLKVAWNEFEDLLKHTEPTDILENRAREFWKCIEPCRQPLVDCKESDQKSISQRNAIKGHSDTYNEKKKSAITLETLTKKLNRALEIISRERKKYIESVLTGICDEVERLYTKLHPDEGVGKIRLYLKPNTIGSLEFDGHFLGIPELPPQAYYSESHLDTLGICVFLALAKYFKTDKTIIVLDDVVTSVDGPHLDRFIELLHSEASNFNQVIVTTHYRPWKDRYRYARGPAAKIQIIELRYWTLANGIQTDEDIMVVQELKNDLASPKLNRQSIASKAGIQLENVLDFFTYQYRCRLPRQTDPNYVLGDLAMGIDSKLGNVLKIIKKGANGASNIEIMLKPLIDEATALPWVRNRAGCHFHELSSEIADSEIKEFGNRVVNLSEAVICQKCLCFPVHRPSGSFWQCECGGLELYPLVHPKGSLTVVGALQ